MSHRTESTGTIPLEPAFRAIVDGLEEGVYIVDADRRIVYWNQGAERLSGFASSEVVGENCAGNLLQHVDERGTPLCLAHCPLHSTLADGQHRRDTVYLRHKHGHRVPISVRVIPLRSASGQVVAAAEIFSSLAPRGSEAPRLREAQRQALQDVPTGVGNRRAAERELAASLFRVREQGASLGVLSLAVDGFIALSDRHGHAVADEALLVVARTMAANVRPRDTLSRWDGGQFLMLLPDVTGPALVAVADRLRVLVKRSRLRGGGGKTLALTVSGAVTMALPGDDPFSIVARADHLLRESQGAGEDRITHDLAEGVAGHLRSRAKESEGPTGTCDDGAGVAEPPPTVRG